MSKKAWEELAAKWCKLYGPKIEAADLIKELPDQLKDNEPESAAGSSPGLDWNTFVPLLGPASKATYSLSSPQIPKAPPGVDFLSSKYIGTETTNCSMFTAYLLGCGFGVPFALEQWKEWQLSRGAEKSLYNGYGPKVVSDWGVGELCAPGTIPKDGVYLIQSFTTWPKGHSWIVLDYDEESDKILTLESNTAGSGLNGVGFGGLGPIRSTNANRWIHKTNMTWRNRTANYTEVHMAKLAIDHQSVRDWIGKQ